MIAIDKQEGIMPHKNTIELLGKGEELLFVFSGDDYDCINREPVCDIDNINNAYVMAVSWFARIGLPLLQSHLLSNIDHLTLKKSKTTLF